MIQIENPLNCCGCTACASVCPQNAISMSPDILGFPYPEVDKSKCTDCGLCQKACVFYTSILSVSEGKINYEIDCVYNIGTQNSQRQSYRHTVYRNI
ncbi:hypothetical protein FACS1894147_09440 [Spirochaetia bacterium]|nr:hypothetical protein FACS1894147_09440 [Spirochaetia bacterium]